MTLPRDTYDGPILAGQVWRSRGTSGHDRYLVGVLRPGAQSVAVRIEGGGPRAGHTRPGKRYSIPTEAFRQGFVLVSQPKGHKGLSPLDLALAAEAAPRTALGRLTSTRPEDLLSTSALRADPVPPDQLDEQIEAFASILLHRAPPPPETPEEETTAMAETEPSPPVTPPQEAPEFEDSPAVAFRAAGGRLLADLGADLDRMRAEREEFWREVEDLDTKIEAAEGRLEAIRVAVERAFALVVHPPQTSGYAAQQAAGALDRTVNPVDTVTTAPPEGVNPEDGTPEGEDPLGPRPTGQGRVSQRAWVEGYLRGEQLQGKREVRVADIAQGFAQEFGFPFNRARMNVSSLMVENNKRTPRLPSWPAMVRSEKGVYRFV